MQLFEKFLVCNVYSFLIGEDVLFIVFMKRKFTYIVAGLSACRFDKCDAGANVLLLLDGQGGCSGKLGIMLALLTASACRTFLGNFMHLVGALSADIDELLSGHCGVLTVLWIVKSDEVGMGSVVCEEAGLGSGC